MLWYCRGRWLCHECQSGLSLDMPDYADWDRAYWHEWTVPWRVRIIRAVRAFVRADLRRLNRWVKK